MTSNKDNIFFEKTSFLQGGNSPFIKDLYLKYLNDPDSIPQSWVEFFDGLGEDQEVIKKEIISLKDRLNKIYSKHTNKSESEIKQALERDNFMNPQEAKSFGLIDEVVEKRS